MMVPVAGNEQAGTAVDNPERVPVANFDSAGVIRIGRNPDNDIVLSDFWVSGQHAEIRKVGNEHTIVDLGSSNGLHHNGRRVPKAILTAGDRFTIGRHEFLFDGANIYQHDDQGPTSIIADDITVEVKHAVLLDDVSFALRHGTLLGIIGPSGCGKSTLLKAMTGIRPASRGKLLYDGKDLYKHYSELRYRIGMVPQDDVLHRQLTVRRALRFAASLSFADDVPRSARRARVNEVLALLGLTNRAKQRIDTLSGGQRKRTSVALELLTEPSLLALDEPTSALDPALDKEVMRELRLLADRGRTVVVVTHSVLHLDLCDHVLVMCLGGRMGFFGPPDELLKFFGAEDYADVFDKVTNDADRCAQLYRNSDIYRKYVGEVALEILTRDMKTPLADAIPTPRPTPRPVESAPTPRPVESTPAPRVTASAPVVPPVTVAPSPSAAPTTPSSNPPDPVAPASVVVSPSPTLSTTLSAPPGTGSGLAGSAVGTSTAGALAGVNGVAAGVPTQAGAPAAERSPLDAQAYPGGVPTVPPAESTLEMMLPSFDPVPAPQPAPVAVAAAPAAAPALVPAPAAVVPAPVATPVRKAAAKPKSKLDARLDRLAAVVFRDSKLPPLPAPQGVQDKSMTQQALHPVAPLRQFLTLCLRMIAVIVSDRGYAAFLIGLPIALAALSRTVPGTKGLGPDPLGFDLEAERRLAVFIVGAAFMGIAISIREIINEASIYRRERAIGLSPTAYLASKVVIFVIIDTIQVLIFIYLSTLGLPGPAEALVFAAPMLDIIIAVTLVAIASTALGLLASALVRSTEQTTPILVVSVMAQLVLSGALFPIAGQAGLEAAAYLDPSRWGMAAAAASTWLRDFPKQIADPNWVHLQSNWWYAVIIMLLQIIALLAAARWALRRYEPGRD